MTTGTFLCQHGKGIVAEVHQASLLRRQQTRPIPFRRPRENDYRAPVHHLRGNRYIHALRDCGPRSRYRCAEPGPGNQASAAGSAVLAGTSILKEPSSATGTSPSKRRFTGLSGNPFQHAQPFHGPGRRTPGTGEVGVRYVQAVELPGGIIGKNIAGSAIRLRTRFDHPGLDGVKAWIVEKALDSGRWPDRDDRRRRCPCRPRLRRETRIWPSGRGDGE